MLHITLTHIFSIFSNDLLFVVFLFILDYGNYVIQQENSSDFLFFFFFFLDFLFFCNIAKGKGGMSRQVIFLFEFKMDLKAVETTGKKSTMHFAQELLMNIQ